MLRRGLHLSLAFLVCLPFAFARHEQDETAEYYIVHGEAALRQNRFAEAKALFEQAEKLPRANAAEVNAGIGMADLQLGHYAAARRREQRVLQLVSNPHERAEAHNLIGTAWLRESLASDTPPDPQKLAAAAQEFQRALGLDPVFDSAYFNLGAALAGQGGEAGARAAFKSSISAAARNPATAAGLPFHGQSVAPEFTATGSQGERISLAGLRGRFVLLDFWATWCAPCIHALPVIRQLAGYFPAERFTLISIDQDYDHQGAWRTFIAQKKMDWLQIWDRDSDIYYSFGYAPRPELIIPRYVFIDPDGYILHVYGGTDRVGLMAGQIVRTVSAQCSH
jgi:tetratricopeptide (TPR) repeat protein